MKIQIDKGALTSALAKVTGVIERKNTLPILSNVYLYAGDGHLTIRATDLDIEVTTRVECAVSEEGDCTLQSDLLTNIVKRYKSSDPVSIAATGDKATISQGRSKFDLSTLDASKFPRLANDEYESTFSIAADELSRLFGKSAFAMSSDETRYHLNGVYFHSTDDGISAVSTDGHRLAKVWSSQQQKFPGVIVPRKTVSEIRKIFDIGNVEVSVSSEKVRFDAGDTVIISKVVDATFPEYERIIPQACGNSFRVDAVDFSGAAASVSLVCDDKISKRVVMDIQKYAIKMYVAGSNNAAEDFVDAVVNGDDVVIGFNSKYLAEALAQADGGDVDVFYKGQSDPIVMRPVEDESMLVVIMPVRV